MVLRPNEFWRSLEKLLPGDGNGASYVAQNLKLACLTFVIGNLELVRIEIETIREDQYLPGF